MKIVISSEGRTFVWRQGDLHCQYGMVREKDMQDAKPGASVTTNTGKVLKVMDADFNELYRRIRRGPQVMPIKDVALAVSLTGVGKKSKVVDAGAGSGAMALYLGNICKQVTTYEVREDFADICEHNIKLLGFSNIKLRRQDVYEGIVERNCDAVFLDLAEPWMAIAPAQKALRAGGFLVSYSPTVPQIMDFVSALPDGCAPRIVECILRDWEVLGRKTRPKSIGIGHSGFIVATRIP